MNVELYRRYCYKQGYGDDLGSALTMLNEYQEKHPEANLIIEYNERSTARVYRIVRLDKIAIEVPDPPSSEEYPIPPRPKAASIPDEEILEEEIQGQRNRTWGATVNLTKLTHIPTGTSVERRIYGEWERNYLRTDLECKVDSTWAERDKEYREAARIRHEAQNQWAKEARDLVKTA